MKTLKSPFNMEEILSCDMSLYEVWKKRPFVFDLDFEGRLTVKYVDMESGETWVPEYQDAAGDGGQVTLNLGCGLKIISDCVNLDRIPGQGVDVVADANKNLPFKDHSFEEVYCEHTLEHLDDVRHVMDEIYRVLKPLGKVKIVVPWWSGEWAVGDPNHKHLFNHKSFEFLCEEAERVMYTGIGSTAKFKRVSQEYAASKDYEKDKFLQFAGFSPILAMEVVLEKQPRGILTA